MSELKKLLHADTGAETYSYEIEQTAEHLTVATLTRDAASGGWKYAVTARRLDAAPAGAGSAAAAEVSAEQGGFGTPDEAIAAARKHAQALLAGR